MKPFVTYLKRQSPPMQLASGGTGWLELPNGQRWNPGHKYKFDGRSSRHPLWLRLFGISRRRHGH
jgi:hypothetical protein